VIANVTRGGNASGVLFYLVGPGKRNEHEQPRLVAGSPEARWMVEDRVLERMDAGELGRFLEEPRKMFGTEVRVAERDEQGRVVGTRAAHVWHCSLSLPPMRPPCLTSGGQRSPRHLSGRWGLSARIRSANVGGSLTSHDASPACSRTGALACAPTAGRWEPDEPRGPVRFCERRGVRLPRATHLVLHVKRTRAQAKALLDSSPGECRRSA
jgi:hypothetical protein